MDRGGLEPRTRRAAQGPTPFAAIDAQRGKIFLFWSTELPFNHVDTVWPYWNLMDFTPAGRPARDLPPQNFRSKFLEEHYGANQ